MNPLRLLLVLTASVFVWLLVSAGPAMSGQRAPVAVFKDPTFGRVLVTRSGQALYTWNKEPAGTITCVGECAKLWPPLLVRSASSLPKTIPGIRGRFGLIRRPDRKLQVTFRGRAVYTYAHDGPRQVLCNDVDGWFVVRV